MANISQTIVALIVVLISLTFHEAAHAFVAYLLGDPTAKNRGRMSLNPIVHIDPLGTVILPLVMALSGSGVFGWAKPVPVNLSNLKNPKRDDALIGAAGPAMNFVLALISSVLIRFALMVHSGGQPSAGLQFILQILLLSVQINLLLMLFNLLPIPPLDGSAILQAFLPAHAAIKFAEIQKYGFLILIILIFTNLLDTLYLGPFSHIFLTIFYSIAGLN